MEWEIGAECLACVLIVLVLCFSREKFYTQMPQTRLYYACLGFALFSTLLNIATVVLMGVPGLLPRWLCYTLNMLYFTFFPLLEAALTYYKMCIRDRLYGAAGQHLRTGRADGGGRPCAALCI